MPSSPSLPTPSDASGPRVTPRSVTLPGGLRVPYVTQGRPDGIPVVMLHGLSDSWRSFALQLAHLPDTVRVFAITLRGHAGAGRPATGYEPVDFARDIAAFMDVIGIDQAVIVGHSLGSLIAQRFAVDFPERALGLVLLGGVRAMREVPGIDELQGAIMALTDPIDPDFVRAFQLGTIAQPVPPDHVEAIIADSLTVPAAVWQAIVTGFIDDATYLSIDSISAPTMLIWGDQDGVGTRAEQDRIVGAIPNARLTVYEGAGHSVHWEEPERVARDVSTFVAGLPR